jgi:hypothetical protein
MEPEGTTVTNNASGKVHRRTTFWLETLKERDHSGDLDVDGRIILRRKYYYGYQIKED